MHTDPPARRWALTFFALHLAQAAVAAHVYPDVIHDPDLYAYFVYFRNWLAGDDALHQAAYFTVPKPLLVLLLGPLASAPLAFLVSALVSATAGSLAYLLGRRAFGHDVGVLFGAALLLDPGKTTLALRSSADLWVGTLVFGAIALGSARRLDWAAACLLVAATIKPVCLPCAAYVLVLTDVPLRRRLLWAAVPALALPVVLATNQALLGTAFGAGKLFGGFETLAEGVVIDASEVVHFVLWRQIAKFTFISSAAWGVLGIVLWIDRDRRRLAEPVLVIPLLFLGGYVAFAVVAPYVPFFRFFWPLEAWFAAFILYGMVDATRRLARGRPALRVGLATAMLVFLADDYLSLHARHRQRFGLPFQQAAAFVRDVPGLLERERRPGETVMTPLAFLPMLMWDLGATAPGNGILIAEQEAGDGSRTRPDWIVYLPDLYAKVSAKPWVEALLREGHYVPRLTDGHGVVFALPTAGRHPPLPRPFTTASK